MNKTFEQLDKEHREALKDLKKESPELLKIFDKILKYI